MIRRFDKKMKFMKETVDLDNGYYIDDDNYSEFKEMLINLYRNLRAASYACDDIESFCDSIDCDDSSDWSELSEDIWDKIREIREIARKFNYDADKNAALELGWNK